MRKPTLILLALLAALLAPARGQDRERQIAIQRLGLKQKDAVDRLDSLLKRVGILIEDLRGMGDEEKAKADLLEQALLIVSAENIETNVLKGSGENQVVLGDLKRAMEALAQSAWIVGSATVSTRSRKGGCSSGKRSHQYPVPGKRRPLVDRNECRFDRASGWTDHQDHGGAWTSPRYDLADRT